MYIYIIRIYKKFIYSIIIKYNNLILILNNIFYTILFNNIRLSNVIKIDTLNDLTVVNHFDNIYNFETIYILLSYKINLRLILKLFCKKEDLIISLSNIFINANWLEREIWDLFGVKFIYHKDLRRILTDYGFIGHPLLKLYPLMGFTELRYDDSLNKIIKDFIELSQGFRLYTYMNPWINWNN